MIDVVVLNGSRSRWSIVSSRLFRDLTNNPFPPPLARSRNIAWFSICKWESRERRRFRQWNHEIMNPGFLSLFCGWELVNDAQVPGNEAWKMYLFFYLFILRERILIRKLKISNGEKSDKKKLEQRFHKFEII